MSERPSPIRSPLGRLAEAITRAPALVAVGCLALAVGAGIYAATSLELRMGRQDLLSEDLPYNVRYREFAEEFSSLEGGIVVVEAEPAGEAAARDFADDLAGDLLDELAGTDARVSWKVDDAAFLRKGALLLPPEDLRRAALGVEKGAPLLEAALGPRGIEGLLGGLADLVGSATSEEDLPREGLPLLRANLAWLRAVVAGEQASPPPAPLAAADTETYFWSDDRRFLFVLIDPYGEEDTALTARVRASLDRVRQRHPGVRAGLTGRPVLAQDEMASSARDMVVATAVSLAVVALLFIGFFRSFRQPLLGMATLLVGVAWAFGAATLVVGHLNLLSVVFGVILIGLGVDFGIHLLSRYQEERIGGAAPPVALRIALQETGGGIVTGAVTTAAAFFAVVFGTFQGIGEMGIVSGMGILLCLVAMLVLFPALLLLFDRGVIRGRPPDHTTPRALVEIYRHPAPLIVLTLLLTAGAGFLVLRMRFNYNLLDLQVPDIESVEYEKKLIAGEGMTTWFCASLWRDLETARRKAEAFEALPTVRKVEGLHRLIPESQEEALRHVAAMRSALSGLPGREIPEPEIRPAEIRTSVDRLVDALDDAEEGAFEAGDAEAAAAVAELRDDVEALGDALRAAEADPERVAAAQRTLQGHLIGLAAEGLAHLPERPIEMADIPPGILERFVGGRGSYLLMVFPAEDIWGREAKGRFLEEVRRVDPDVTGAPVQVYESVAIMVKGYQKAGLLALAVVFVVILVDFRSLRSSLLALAPLLMGAVWMGGAMTPLGLEFNNANLLVLPLILGIGVVNGVHVMHRYREHPRALVDILWGSTGRGVVLTSLTTIAGCLAIGIIAEHPGLSSLGYVLSLGVATCLLSCFLALPPLMQLFFRTARRASRERTGRRARPEE